MFCAQKSTQNSLRKMRMYTHAHLQHAPFSSTSNTLIVHWLIVRTFCYRNSPLVNRTLLLCASCPADWYLVLGQRVRLSFVLPTSIHCSLHRAHACMYASSCPRIQYANTIFGPHDRDMVRVLWNSINIFFSVFCLDLKHTSIYCAHIPTPYTHP